LALSGGSMSKGRISLFLLLAFVSIAMGTSFAAGTGYGTSKIVLSSANITLVPGSSASVSYNVTLASGNYWGTSINVANKPNVSAAGLSVSFSSAYGDPPFSGTAAISAAASAKPGRYVVLFNATGDDPSVSDAVLTVYVKSPSASTTTSIQPQPSVPTFALYNSTSSTINASKGASLSLKASDGKYITVAIPAGTYVKEANKTLSTYNFTLAIYSIKNVSTPSSLTGYVPAYGFAYLVNGLITPTIEFVNSTGSPRPLVTTAQYNSTWTSWTFLGGKQVGTSYVGGNYSFANVWKYNATSNEIVNTQFYKPVMWVFLLKIPSAVTSAPTTAPTAVTTTPTTTPPPKTAYSNTGIYIVIAIIVIIIIIGAAYALRRAKK